ncbi:MAG: putative DNA-binding domain-containing protein [Acidiferrobacterales bacterium]
MLRKLQHDILRDLVTQERDPAALNWINGKGSLSAERQYSAYRHSVQGGLAEALGEIYPVCQELVGENFFTGMALEYIRLNPSISPDLTDYGDNFDQFIASFEPAASLPYFADVATLEWHWHRVFNGINPVSAGINSLANLNPEQQLQLRFKISGNIGLVQSNYPVHRIWQVNQEEHEGDDIVNLDDGGIRLIIWRDKLTMRIDPLNENEWMLINAVRSGKKFEEICRIFSALNEEDIIGQFLAQCFQNGWVQAVELADISMS